jgi:glycogen debranching enzyme
VIAPVRRAGHRVTPYTLGAEKLSAGSTLGSPRGVLVLKATGAIEKFFSPEAGKDAFGSVVVRHWDAGSRAALRRRSSRVTIGPDREEHELEFAGGVAACERIFPHVEAPRSGDLHDAGAPAAYYEVELRNEGDCAVDIATYAAIRLRGGFDSETSAHFDESLQAFIVRSKELREMVRIAASSVEPVSHEVTTDIAKAAAPNFPGRLSNRTVGTAGDPIGILHFQNRLQPGESARFSLVFTFALDGEDSARRAFSSLPPCGEAMTRTREYYETVLNRAVVMTPNPEINRGVLWAKTNMLRSLLLTSEGWCFVNDPTQTTKSVARDTSWFGFGADYVVPWFVRRSLLWFAEHLTRDGMVVEWYDTRTGKTETYGLDMNDNTPLLILALRHHYCVTSDREFLDRAFPQALRAGRYIVSKRGARGLVWCHADGTGSRGIVGWRNAIQGYRLAGATTKLNSECYAALSAVSMMAEEVGESKIRDEFACHAGELRAAINEHLLDASRRLYYLTIDESGHPQTDITSDLVFPILFGVADDGVATNLIATLSRPEFWSAAGLRTIPRDSLNYAPVDGSGLLGGVWAGPTFWFAAAAARYNPDITAEALAITFKHYAEDPLRYNTVPGQFCEWLHGETLTNQGMMLSPWFAPKYLWAAIEATAGLTSDGAPIEVRARLPRGWSWTAVRNVNLRGTETSWFTVRIDDRLVTYATEAIASADERHRYRCDVSDDFSVSGDGIACIALQRSDSVVVLLANSADRTIPTAVVAHDLSLPPRVRLRRYESLSHAWRSEENVDSARLRQGLALQLDRGGFCLLEIDLSS